MSHPLRVLIVDDQEDDAELVLLELQRGGYTPAWERVDEPGPMRDALRRAQWDLVLCDWSLPRFSALSALAIVKESGLDLPFIMVSGTVGEETVVAALHGGANDFVSKDKLTRLVPAIERELREKDARRAAKDALRGAEEALRISQARFAKLSEAGIIGVYIADGAGTVTEANDAFLQLIGYSREELRSGSVQRANLTPPEWMHVDDVAKQQLEANGVAKPRRKAYVRKDGSLVPVLVGKALLEEGRFIAFVIDLTEQKQAEDALRRAEEQLRHAQKMEAIGSLAGGIAHDFNNLLSVILSYSSMLLGDMKGDAPGRAELVDINAAGQRAADLTKQLLAFSRKQILEPRVVDLNDIITNTDRMIRRIVGEDIELRTIPSEALRKVKVDPGQVEQVLMNLVVNARDAMPNGGALTIETRNVDLDEAYAAQHPGVAPGPYVMLAVSDTGQGMDRETQARVFEPFFTTKDLGKGTGLGLSTTFGIVQQSGGSIWLYSEVGKGTTFKVYFPQTKDAVSLKPARSLQPAPAGTETILLVEDEPQVRTLAKRILVRRGYTVIDFATPAEALEGCQGFAGAIHLLVTDVVMPGMNGRELAKLVVAERPAIKVLYLSGYTANAIVHHGVLDPSVAFLQKPITPDALAIKVREVLDA